jgi:hypothetical protein
MQTYNVLKVDKTDKASFSFQFISPRPPLLGFVYCDGLKALSVGQFVENPAWTLGLLMPDCWRINRI